LGDLCSRQTDILPRDQANRTNSTSARIPNWSLTIRKAKSFVDITELEMTNMLIFCHCIIITEMEKQYSPYFGYMD